MLHHKKLQVTCCQMWPSFEINSNLHEWQCTVSVYFTTC